VSGSAAKKQSIKTRTILALALVFAILAAVGLPSPAAAQTWPTTWILIDTDANEPGQANYRDVLSAYYNYDSNHLYLRLNTVSTPVFSGANGPARFKWFIDVGLGSNLYLSGGDVRGSDFLLFVEDSDNNGSGEIYLLPANGNDRYTQYEPWNSTNVLPISNPSIASYRISGNSIDIWIAFSQLPPATSPAHMSLAWGTDQEDPGLESAPNLDSTDGSDVPIHLDADLLVTKDVSSHTPLVGNNVIYTVTVTNTGPATATNVQITDLLPLGVTYQSYSATQGGYASGSGLWTVGTLANGASATLSITVTVTGAGAITNTATITAVDQPDPDPGDNSDSVTINPVTSDADLSVLKDVSNHTPYEGASINFTVVVTNTGPADATSVQITDSLPAGVTYQSFSATQGVYASGTGIWTVGTLLDGASATLTITATVNAGTAGSTINNTATVTGASPSDPHTGDNSDTVEFFPTAYEADLSVVKYVNNTLPYEGSTITFTVAVQNNGPVTGTNIQITDQLPAAVTYQSHSASAGTYIDSTGIWAVPSLGTGAFATLTITATVNAGTAGSTSFNTAAVTALDQPDLDPADDSSTAGFTPTGAPAGGGARQAPVFPSLYLGIGAALGAAIVAYVVRRKLTDRGI